MTKLPADPGDRVPDDAVKWGRAIYPWNEWFNGQTWQLSLAKHFPRCKSLVSAYGLIRNAAVRRHIKLKCRLDYEGQSIFLKATSHGKTSKHMEEKRGSIRSTVRHPSSSTQRRK